MADTVTSRVIQNTNSEYVVNLTCVSDGTGESAVVKVDKSTLTNAAGNVPLQVKLMAAQWSIQGFSYVKLAWDATTDDTFLLMAGNGYQDWESAGGLKDPRSSGAVGDIVLTSAGAASGATYSITLFCELQ